MHKSDKTKTILAHSIKKIMEKKCLEKITVQEIVDGCEMIRQTFYNHFIDKQDLVNWIYKTEVIDVVNDMTFDLKSEEFIKECFLITLNTMYREKAFYVNAFKSSGQNSFLHFFGNVTVNNMKIWIEAQAGERIIKPIDKEFLAKSCALLVTDVIFEWARSGMQFTPRELIDRLYSFLTTGMFGAINDFSLLTAK